MSAMEPLCRLMGFNYSILSKEELLILEAEIFIRVCEALKELFKEQYKNYFNLMKFTREKEDFMLKTNLVRLIIHDILSSGEYNLNGLAYYTDTPVDVIQEIIDERNMRPSAVFLWRIIELHKVVKPDYYKNIIRKIVNDRKLNISK